MLSDLAIVREEKPPAVVLWLVVGIALVRDWSLGALLRKEMLVIRFFGHSSLPKITIRIFEETA
jgi:hypothetical protein